MSRKVIFRQLCCIIMLFALVITGCRVRSSHFWLSDCEQPCWSGIHFADTTVDQARILLQQNELVNSESLTIDSGKIYPYLESQQSMEFTLQQGQGNGRLAINSENGTIVGVYLYPEGYAALSELIEQYGNPQQVHSYLTSGGHQCYGADLFYPNQNIVLTIGDCSTVENPVLSNDETRVIIKPTATVRKIVFLTSNNTFDDLLSSFYLHDDESIQNAQTSSVSWVGYSEYPRQPNFYKPTK